MLHRSNNETPAPRRALVAFPRLLADDLRRIESFRGAHDPQAKRIGVHFTLVFPAAFDRETARDEAATVAARSLPIEFTIRRATAVRDPSEGGGYVFLVPETGRAELLDLHARLHSGALRPLLHGAPPFVPHLTIASDTDFHRCEALAREWNDSARELRGTLPTIEIFELGAGPIET